MSVGLSLIDTNYELCLISRLPPNSKKHLNRHGNEVLNAYKCKEASGI